MTRQSPTTQNRAQTGVGSFMKRFMISSLLLFMIFVPDSPATAISLWDMVNDNQTVYLVLIKGKGQLPPGNPFESPRIEEIHITYPYNKTHERVVYCYSDGIIHEKILPKGLECHQIPFNITSWNTTKILSEYQWGLERYLPTPSNNWSNHITDWVLLMNKFSRCDILVPRLYQHKRVRTLRVSRPLKHNLRVESTKTENPPIPHATLSTKTIEQDDEKTCGPALLVGLALISALLERRINGKR